MRCPASFRRCSLGGRWLVDGALVNPVPVSAARALGARLVIAVNLNADMLGRGITVGEVHGSDDERRMSATRTGQAAADCAALFGSRAHAASGSSSAAPTGRASRP